MARRVERAVAFDTSDPVVALEILTAGCWDFLLLDARPAAAFAESPKLVRSFFQTPGVAYVTELQLKATG
jgi:hypothetical protein